MKLPKINRIDQCVSKDASRWVINHPWLQKWDKRHYAVATDGKMMVVVPVECDPSDRERKGIPVGEVAHALRSAKSGDRYVTLHTAQDGAPAGDYVPPNPVPILDADNPREARETHRSSICLYASRLALIAKALGNPNVRLHIKDAHSPVIVEPDAGALYYTPNGKRERRPATPGSFGLLQPTMSSGQFAPLPKVESALLADTGALLNQWVADSECYCCDVGVAVKGTCAYCKTVAWLKSTSNT